MSAPLHTFAANGRGTADCLLLGGDTCHSTEHSFPGLLPACVPAATDRLRWLLSPRQAALCLHVCLLPYGCVLAEPSALAAAAASAAPLLG
jgi:hypothetical protein